MTKAEIQAKVQSYYDMAAAAGYNVFAVVLLGSQIYGLDEYSEEYTSDIDVFAIVFNSFEDLIGNSTPIQRIGYTPELRLERTQVHLCTFVEFMRGLMSQNMRYIDPLFSEYYAVNKKYKDVYEKLRSHRAAIATASQYAFAEASVRFIRATYSALAPEDGSSEPSNDPKIQKFGYNPKRLHHLARCLLLMTRYYNGRPYEECIKVTGEDRERLMRLKKGLGYDEAKAAIAAGRGYMNSIEAVANLIKQKHPQDEVNQAVFEYLRSLMAILQKQAIRAEVRAKTDYIADIVDNIGDDVAE